MLPLFVDLYPLPGGARRVACVLDVAESGDAARARSRSASLRSFARFRAAGRGRGAGVEVEVDDDNEVDAETEADATRELSCRVPADEEDGTEGAVVDPARARGAFAGPAAFAFSFASLLVMPLRGEGASIPPAPGAGLPSCWLLDRNLTFAHAGSFSGILSAPKARRAARAMVIRSCSESFGHSNGRTSSHDRWRRRHVPPEDFCSAGSATSLRRLRRSARVDESQREPPTRRTTSSAVLGASARQ